MKRVHVLVAGRVQGVWYRASAARKASELGLTGWVRNLPDGRVELVAEGDAESVDALLAWCRRGPPLARVTGLDVREMAVTGEFTEFAVLRDV
ncbi:MULTISPECIES: acylphosphatase [Methylococcus]|jgi:acylphosphatase|uniref:Acylphosphatase n=1 Tax=Methylococcus capsulatus (strain ATCC 33009 / NCIMB 11132 / Bath) TaxID=243233 RepID=ACYP_METCA|nr:acylphosphatase [Methylococcus capsulatus]Q60AX4.1 RecName: Full=Acylphosphatase; AltName: Full=Acylphosphate phosphohydrolase [Methylococcus capsulatus str. Bath]AAU93141.1 acylphosphatase [Methylococcus capsulatus str. Bath]QXP88489.1 acylphosphatase [Methylococcus capsulatus]QXP90154.1 acylphosphatase [Methylococcus capsulatus]QXP94495.1 acylphosphatase [Methylococcus capsulatus]UQN13538.1 acylphosphatase [Methylococcus capsulatus]